MSTHERLLWHDVPCTTGLHFPLLTKVVGLSEHREAVLVGLELGVDHLQLLGQLLEVTVALPHLTLEGERDGQEGQRRY